MIQNSHQLWPFYFSRNENTVYGGYREDWYSNTKYQYDSYQGDDFEVFDCESVDRNIDLAFIHIDAVPVDTAHSPLG